MNLSKDKGVKNIDQFAERAECLVAISHCEAIQMFVPLLDLFPILKVVNLNRWDFFVTIAGVFIASKRLYHIGIDSGRVSNLMDIIFNKMTEWNKDSLSAFVDCNKVFEEELEIFTSLNDDLEFVGPDAIGVWIVWNILGRKTRTDDEFRLVRSVGGMVIPKFYNWWDI